MSKHTLLIRFQAARSTYRQAQEACPHWDYEGGPYGGRAECCDNLDDTGNELFLANKNAQKEYEGEGE